MSLMSPGTSVRTPQLYTLKCMEKLTDGQELRVLVDNPSLSGVD